MGIIKEYISKWRAYKKKFHERNIRRRAEEIFTIDDIDGKIWFFCNGIGMFPCSFVNLKDENEIMEFLNNLRKFYIDTE